MAAEFKFFSILRALPTELQILYRPVVIKDPLVVLFLTIEFGIEPINMAGNIDA